MKTRKILPIFEMEKGIAMSCWQFFRMRRQIKTWINSLLDKNDLVLDVGCGAKPYYQSGTPAVIMGVDIEKYPLITVQCDAACLPFKEKVFDKILCISAFYYLRDPFRVAKEFARVLSDGGLCILFVPFIYPIHDAPLDKYRFTEYGIRTVLGNDFQTIDIKPWGGIFALPMVLIHSLSKGLWRHAPRGTRGVAKLLAMLLYPLYISSQFVELLDVLDISNRWPMGYFVVASKLPATRFQLKASLKA